jgi:hypothetical protein
MGDELARNQVNSEYKGDSVCRRESKPILTIRLRPHYFDSFLNAILQHSPYYCQTVDK